MVSVAKLQILKTINRGSYSLQDAFMIITPENILKGGLETCCLWRTAQLDTITGHINRRK